MGTFAHEGVQYYATIDYDQQMSIVAIWDNSSEEQIIGVDRHLEEKNSDKAALAVLVHGDWQGQGIGTLMDEYLEQMARSDNIHGFKGEVLEQNTRALHVFTRLGRKAKTEYDEGVYTVS